jgi:hypothetical protein
VRNIDKVTGLNEAVTGAQRRRVRARLDNMLDNMEGPPGQ